MTRRGHVLGGGFAAVVIFAYVVGREQGRSEGIMEANCAFMRGLADGLRRT